MWLIANRGVFILYVILTRNNINNANTFMRVSFFRIIELDSLQHFKHTRNNHKANQIIDAACVCDALPVAVGHGQWV